MDYGWETERAVGAENGEKKIITPGSPHGQDKFLQPKELKGWNFKNQLARFWESLKANRNQSLYF